MSKSVARLRRLNAVEQADFLFLLDQTGLTKGNPCQHTAKLEAAGYVDVEKAIVGKIPRTVYRLTKVGQRALRLTGITWPGSSTPSAERGAPTYAPSWPTIRWRLQGPNRRHQTQEGNLVSDATRVAQQHLAALCSVQPDRRPGGHGNHQATEYVAGELERASWTVQTQEFRCLDWVTDGASITVGDTTLALTPSPYGLGVAASGPLRILHTVESLRRTDLAGSIVLLTDQLAAEPLTPRAFPFYGSEEHTVILDSLEESRPAAVIAVTGRYPELCGALDPFPLIEDGDFTIPVANVRPADALPLLNAEGSTVSVEIRSERRPSQARNIMAVRENQNRRITVVAHIDTKPGTPGAVDNAAGVVALLLLADLLSPTRHPHLPVGIELLIVNGEDHFAAPGEVAWLEANDGRLDQVTLMVNIDGAGYCEGGSAFSLYNVDDEMAAHLKRSFAGYADITEGPAWYQSDHAIFAMQGRAALAITTERVEEMLADLFHSRHDTSDKVDINRIINIATALESLLANWPGKD